MIDLPIEESLLHERLGRLASLQPLDRLQHSRNVAGLSATLAGLMDCNEDQIRKMHLGGLLHDIGKQFIPGSVLDKPGKLTKEEFEQVQRHPWLGYVHLYRFVSDSIILNTVLYHHERWNGSGYPHGLVHDEIPLEARICAITDVWDALISNRCYRSAWSVLQATELIAAGAGSLFDPEIVFLFTQLVEDGCLVRNQQEKPINKALVLQKSTGIVAG